MLIPYKPIPRRKPMSPMTDAVLDNMTVDDRHVLSCHSELLHRLAEHMETGLAHGLPSRYMDDDEFVRHVKAGDFDV